MEKKTSPARAARSLTEPITITVSGNMAAILRLNALIDGVSPEAFALNDLRTTIAGDLANGFGFQGEEQAKDWLEEKAS